jgi:hypothetical protein
MNIHKIVTRNGAVALFGAVLLLHSNVVAGPPLLCEAFEIGSAKSLPWQGPDWTTVRPDYDVGRLIDDTLALLNAETPVIVRMETLRRATVYARKDPKLAAALLSRLKARAHEAEARGERNALALFDAGYLVETYRQAHAISIAAREEYWKFSQSDPGKDSDGYALVLKAIQYRGGDAEMEFAAALMTAEGKQAYEEHLRRAVAGALGGSLLARNLERHFAHRGKRPPSFAAGSA